MALAVEQSCDFGAGKAAQLLQRADHAGPRARIAHDPGRGRLAAQRIVEKAGDGGAILGAGETMGDPPVLDGFGGRPALFLDVGKDFYGGGDTRGGNHLRALRKLWRATHNRHVWQ